MQKIGKIRKSAIRFFFGLLFFFISFIYSDGFERLSGDISSVEFDPAQKYYIAQSDIEVPENTTLVIPSGIIICFRPNTEFRINGQCSITGTAASPTVLTSMNDSLYCSSSTEPGPYDWKGIKIAESAPEVVFNHIEIKYAEAPLVSKAQKLILERILCFKSASPVVIIADQQIAIPTDTTISLVYPQAVPPPPPNPPVIDHGKDVVRTSDSLSENQKIHKPDLPRVEPSASSGTRKRMVRWGLLSVGSVATITCGGTLAGYFLENRKFEKENDNYGVCDPANGGECEEAYINRQEASDNMYYLKPVSIISGIAGALLFAGFGLTFYF
jgi:hypothetical protein